MGSLNVNSGPHDGSAWASIGSATSAASFLTVPPTQPELLAVIEDARRLGLRWQPTDALATAMHISSATHLAPFVVGFGTLSYLDLCRTKFAGNHGFLNTLAHRGTFRHISILKLRGVNIDDHGLRTIVTSAARNI